MTIIVILVLLVLFCVYCALVKPPRSHGDGDDDGCI